VVDQKRKEHDQATNSCTLALNFHRESPYSTRQGDASFTCGFATVNANDMTSNT
jgi:hypothetical protein